MTCVKTTVLVGFQCSSPQASGCGYDYVDKHPHVDIMHACNAIGVQTKQAKITPARAHTHVHTHMLIMERAMHACGHANTGTRHARAHTRMVAPTHHADHATVEHPPAARGDHLHTQYMLADSDRPTQHSLGIIYLFFIGIVCTHNTHKSNGPGAHPSARIRDRAPAPSSESGKGSLEDTLLAAVLMSSTHTVTHVHTQSMHALPEPLHFGIEARKALPLDTHTPTHTHTTEPHTDTHTHKHTTEPHTAGIFLFPPARTHCIMCIYRYIYMYTVYKH